MISVYVPCPACAGACYVHPPPIRFAWLRCPACDGLGRAWAPGAPRYGCAEVLADRNRGEIVLLGNGDLGRILREDQTGTPTTWLGLIDGFDGAESHAPIAYPSCIGVVRVSAPRPRVDTKYHGASKTLDIGDPMLRRRVTLC